MPKEILDKKVEIDIDGDGRSDIKLDIKFIGLLVGGIISLTMTYSQLTAEIELAKELPQLEIKQDEVVNQKIEFLQKEIDNLQEQVKSLENKVYKR
jgi:hypothetical protein